MHKALVRPQLGSSVPSWSPMLMKDDFQPKQVQGRAARPVKGLERRLKGPSLFRLQEKQRLFKLEYNVGTRQKSTKVTMNIFRLEIRGRFLSIRGMRFWNIFLIMGAKNQGTGLGDHNIPSKSAFLGRYPVDPRDMTTRWEFSFSGCCKEKSFLKRQGSIYRKCHGFPWKKTAVSTLVQGNFSYPTHHTP